MARTSCSICPYGPAQPRRGLHARPLQGGAPHPRVRVRFEKVVFDIFTSKGQDMVFTVYGEHWRKMKRIMIVPFFTNKVVQQYWAEWEPGGSGGS
ncbi:hypothetical protein RHMOL_Rhmol07G0142200 [Rhododendron molle]|uniref:Uncharacterized protein n=1 Tax=Rhododendron molle TaxID=49168 RepID=A0ACC0N1U9_RHOML|nr:hypothetical protein RHMOL_Rhmol07G0142200 [Rhododendron molle]